MLCFTTGCSLVEDMVCEGFYPSKKFKLGAIIGRNPSTEDATQFEEIYTGNSNVCQVEIK